MNRKEKVLHHIDRDTHGVEIGPSHNPIAPKREGYNVHIIDHMDRDGLVKKYTGHGVNLDQIEEVDFIWHGETYAELTGQSKHYDWIIASHVIEHTPDLIAFLHSCDSILKDDGVLSLVIPDKRYCFDHYRPITGISQIIDSHVHGHRIHSPGTAAECRLNSVTKSHQIAWDANTRGPYNLAHSLDSAQQDMKSALEDNTYTDFHAWCFVPHSFRLIIHDLFCLGLSPFQEAAFFPTYGCEFYVTLSRRGPGLTQSRLEMLQQIEAELQAKPQPPALSPRLVLGQGKRFWRKGKSLAKQIVKRSLR